MKRHGEVAAPESSTREGVQRTTGSPLRERGEEVTGYTVIRRRLSLVLRDFYLIRQLAVKMAFEDNLKKRQEIFRILYKKLKLLRNAVGVDRQSGISV